MVIKCLYLKNCYQCIQNFAHILKSLKLKYPFAFSRTYGCIVPLPLQQNDYILNLTNWSIHLAVNFKIHFVSSHFFFMYIYLLMYIYTQQVFKSRPHDHSYTHNKLAHNKPCLPYSTSTLHAEKRNNLQCLLCICSYQKMGHSVSTFSMQVTWPFCFSC